MEVREQGGEEGKRGRGREGRGRVGKEEERERNINVRDTLNGYLPHRRWWGAGSKPRQRIEPKTLQYIG